jgi:hypothetical protein
MLQLARAIVGVACDILGLMVSFLQSSTTIRAENLVLRRQLASYIERGIKPRRVDHACGSRDARQPRHVHQTVRLARCSGQHSTCDHCSLAPNGVAHLLALEVQGVRATSIFAEDRWHRCR